MSNNCQWGVKLGAIALISCGFAIAPRFTAPVMAQEVAQVTAQNLITHLQSINARMYGAHWCPHCQAQRELFGSANVLVNAGIYVECAQGGPTRATPWLCTWNRIRAYPTWIINGERYEGVQSLERVAAISGFAGAVR
jgi:hypothetical protein